MYICIVSFENSSIVSVCTVDRDIFAGISISLVNFSRSLNFVARLFVTKIGMGRRMLHKIFRVPQVLSTVTVCWGWVVLMVRGCRVGQCSSSKYTPLLPCGPRSKVNPNSVQRLALQYNIIDEVYIYSTTLGPCEVSWLKRCPHFRGCLVHFCMYVVGTIGIVSWLERCP